MKKIYAGLFLISCATLLLELSLLRVFDVILYSNISYLVITSALFCFGLAGVYSSIRPLPSRVYLHNYISKLSALFAISAILILPVTNTLPFDYGMISKEPVMQLFYFLLLYFFLALPFFFAGLMFTTIFTIYALKIQRLYFWDLFGAAIGSAVIIPLVPVIGPAGNLFVVTSFGLLAGALFSINWKYKLTGVFLAVIVFAVPFLKSDYFEFTVHVNKRGIKTASEKNWIEYTYWDPISKIDVINPPHGKFKHIAYDGGSQSSFIYPFDGDYNKLRNELPDSVTKHFWSRGVIVSHFLKQNESYDALIIGSAGGQETKAALTFGAKSIDAVEMVGAVVDIGKHKYAKYNGNIFNHPKVTCVVEEGRSFLRRTNKKYDIIQIFSNHTSSSIAAGTGAMATTYLQTAEAYVEYFTHLKPSGILHINHHVYPKEITTAALAWKSLGLKDFKKHVIVYELQGIQDNLPTLLIKMSPWTESEFRKLQYFFSLETDEKKYNWVYKPVVNPFVERDNFLSDDFFTGNIPEELIDKIPFRVAPSTDDKPYFNFLRKKYKVLNEDSSSYLNLSTASLLNKQLKGGIIPVDVIHLIVTAVLSVIFIFLFVFIPLRFSNAGKSGKWSGKKNTLVYFSCLGMGFIIFELVLIQIFMKLIGSPLYTYSTIVFVLLVAAGLGSFYTNKLNISLENRWYLPFVGIIVTSAVLLIIHPYIFYFYLASDIIIRILVAIILLAPLGFFLGMPFPLGILATEKQPIGAIAWAWAMNGLFTVVGGLLSVFLSIQFGFRITLIIAIIIYGMAFLVFSRVRNTVVGQIELYKT